LILPKKTKTLNTINKKALDDRRLYNDIDLNCMNETGYKLKTRSSKNK
jgi:hypothetical protein